MKTPLLGSIALVGALVAAPAAHAHGGEAIVGAVIGAGAGAAIGQAMGGRDGALVGGAIGAFTGTAIATSGHRGQTRWPVHRVPVVPVYYPPAPVYYPPGRIYAPPYGAPPVIYRAEPGWRGGHGYGYGHGDRHSRRGWH